MWVRVGLSGPGAFPNFLKGNLAHNNCIGRHRKCRLLTLRQSGCSNINTREEEAVGSGSLRMMARNPIICTARNTSVHRMRWQVVMLSAPLPLLLLSPLVFCSSSFQSCLPSVHMPFVSSRFQRMLLLLLSPCIAIKIGTFLPSLFCGCSVGVTDRLPQKRRTSFWFCYLF